MTTAEMKIRYNELMRIAKGDEFMSMTEFEELLALTKKLAKQPLPGRIPRKNRRTLWISLWISFLFIFQLIGVSQG